MPFVETAGKHFHLIIVAYDAFNGEEKDAVVPYAVLENSYEHEGNCAAAYIKEHFDGKIDVMYGCSAGTWILLETLKLPKVSHLQNTKLNMIFKASVYS